MNKKVVVFGGSGFLGSHVADTLSDKGFDVTIFDRANSKFLRPDQKMIIGDILNQSDVNNAIKGCTYVYHFAGIADIKEAQDNPIETVKYNILGTTYILDSCVKNRIKRFIYASTIYVYSEHGSFYRSSKQATELIIENFNKTYKLNYTILRYGSLYGKRANEFNFINNIIKQAFKERKITRKGDGEEIREYINVLDAARASVEILNEEFCNSYIMITGNQTMKVKELLLMIKEIFNNDIQIEFLDEKIDEHYEITPYSFKPRVAKKYLLNYYHDLGQGVLDLIYSNYNDIAKNDPNIILPKSAKY